MSQEIQPVAGVEQNGGTTVVHLAGELDLYNAHVVRDALMQATGSKPERIVVDLGEVTFVDSTALGVLVEARKSLGNGRAFLLASPGLETRRALEVSGLDKHFAVHGSLTAALAADL